MRIGFLALALAAFALGCDGAGDKGGGPAGGQAAPAFTLKDLDGKEVSLASFRGKAVLLSFWAVGCPPCRQEVPALKQLQERYGNKEFTVLAVNQWNEPENTVRAFVKGQGINYPILLQGGSVGKQYGVRGIPTIFYLDSEGRIVSSDVGAREESEIEAKVKMILPRSSGPGG